MHSESLTARAHSIIFIFMSSPPTFLPAATLMLANMPDDITIPEVINALTIQIRRLLANVYKKKRNATSSGCFVFLNFHTIMAAEQLMADSSHVNVIVRGVSYQLEWTYYPFEHVLLLGFMDDFPLDELLTLIRPYAHVKQLFKTTAHPNLVVLHTASGEQAQAVQRALYGTLFRDKPLFVGSERPSFQNLKGMYYVSIKHIQPDVPDAWYKAPSIMSQLTPSFQLHLNMDEAYKAIALAADSTERVRLIAALRNYGALQLNEWNTRVQMLERLSS